MTQHVGIVACSAEGPHGGHRIFCQAAAARMGKHRHPEVSLQRCPWGTHRISEVETGGTVAELLICPDNTLCEAFPLVVRQSPHPVAAYIAETVAHEAQMRRFRRLGFGERNI